MARTVKEEEYNAKRNQILDLALHLVYTKGYQQMTIQDILDGLHISRGALYHYFDSKEALLEALVDRMGMAAERTLLPIVQDPHLSALDKFHRYFEAGARWKGGHKELILSLMRVWYAEENAFIRQKMTRESLKNTPRLLEPMIRQGILEGVFTTRFPEQVAIIVAGVGLSLTDAMAGLLLSSQTDEAKMQEQETILAAYVDTIERILGAPAGSLQVFGPDAFKEWLDADQPEPASE